MSLKVMETRLVVSGWGLRSGGKFNSVQEKLEFTFCAYFSSKETLEFVSVYFRFIFSYMKMTENLGENLKKEGIMRCSTTIPISPNNQQIICIFSPFPFHSLSNKTFPKVFSTLFTVNCIDYCSFEARDTTIYFAACRTVHNG